MKRYTIALTKVECEMYKSLFTIGLATWLVFFGACKTQQNNLNRTTSFPVLLRDNYSGEISTQSVLIKNQKSLAAFLSKVNRTRKPGLEIPVVDFHKDMVLVWCVGETMIPDTGLVLLKETDSLYSFKKIAPTKNQALTAVLSPFVMYLLPHTDKRIEIK